VCVCVCVCGSVGLGAQLKSRRCPPRRARPAHRAVHGGAAPDQDRRAGLHIPRHSAGEQEHQSASGGNSGQPRAARAAARPHRRTSGTKACQTVLGCDSCGSRLKLRREDVAGACRVLRDTVGQVVYMCTARLKAAVRAENQPPESATPDRNFRAAAPPPGRRSDEPSTPTPPSQRTLFRCIMTHGKDSTILCLPGAAPPAPKG
jgi:hypothetical protein